MPVTALFSSSSSSLSRDAASFIYYSSPSKYARRFLSRAVYGSEKAWGERFASDVAGLDPEESLQPHLRFFCARRPRRDDTTACIFIRN